METRFALGLVAVLLTAPLAARANCVTSVLSNGRPLTSGWLAFQGVIDDKESYVYVYDLRQDGFVADSHLWNDTLVDAHNPSLSKDGRWIVFMARPAENTPMRIWAWNPSLSAPTDLTLLSHGNTNLYDEDPKFSPDNTHIIFKRNGSIFVMAVTGLDGNISVKDVHRLVGGKRGMHSEASGPVLSVDNGFAYFFRHPEGQDKRLERLTLDNFETVEDMPYRNASGTESYYPALRQNGVVYFARHVADAGNGDPGPDSIYFMRPNRKMKSAALAPDNLCNAVEGDVENADPAPIGSDLLAFSSTFGTGQYSLYVGNGQGEVWDFSGTQIPAVSGALQGASYAPY